MMNYVYVIAGKEAAYVGRTCCPRRRFNDHRWGGRRDVKKLCMERHLFLVSKPMPKDQAKAIEVRLMKWLSQGNVVLLNRPSTYDLRKIEPDLPSRSEMVRRLIERAIEDATKEKRK